MKNEELKPCPFCGSEVELEKKPLWYGNGRGYKDCYEFVIRCKKCGCRVDQPKNDSVYRSEEKAKKNAIEAWNRRTADEVGQYCASDIIPQSDYFYCGYAERRTDDN